MTMRSTRTPSEPEGRGAAWTEERGTSDEGRRCLQAPRRRASERGTPSEPEGRGAAWTEERGTSDEGRRCLQAPRRRASEEHRVSRRGAAPPGLRSEARATREGGASRRPAGERARNTEWA